MCVNFVYDLNGLKGPNKVGRDIGFITALYAKNSEVVAPVPFDANADTSTHSQKEAMELCSSYSDDSRLPNKHELSSLFYNKNLLGNINEGNYWSSTIASADKAWDQNFSDGARGKNMRTDNNRNVRCIKK